MADPSPCRSHLVPLIGSPTLGVPLRVIEDTSIWFRTARGRVQIGKGCMCYVAEYDRVTQIGVIFLCTTSPHNTNMFVRVCGGVNSGVAGGIHEDGSPILETDPLLAYDSMFYLNISHPIRMRVVHVYSRSFRGGLWHHSLPAPPPPPIGVLDLVWENMSREECSSSTIIIVARIWSR